MGIRERPAICVCIGMEENGSLVKVSAECAKLSIRIMVQPIAWNLPCLLHLAILCCDYTCYSIFVTL